MKRAKVTGMEGLLRLADKKSLFYDEYVAEAIELMQRYEPKAGYYLTFSGGKDSQVLLDLTKKAGVKYDAHFSNTGLEAPENIKFIRTYYRDVKFEKPSMSIRDAIIKKGIPPTFQARYCCAVLKETGGDNRFVLTGIRRSESSKRSKRNQLEVSSVKMGNIFLHPIFKLENGDVWHYILSNNLPIHPLYLEGFRRIGCVMCPLQRGKGMRADALRWPNTAKRFRKWFGEMYEAHKDRLAESRSWRSGDCIYQWWIEDGGADGQEGSCSMGDNHGKV